MHLGAVPWMLQVFIKLRSLKCVMLLLIFHWLRATVATECQNWCPSHFQTWEVKCAWLSKCDGCSECSGGLTLNHVRQCWVIAAFIEIIMISRFLHNFCSSSFIDCQFVWVFLFAADSFLNWYLVLPPLPPHWYCHYMYHRTLILSLHVSPHQLPSLPPHLPWWTRLSKRLFVWDGVLRMCDPGRLNALGRHAVGAPCARQLQVTETHGILFAKHRH